MPWLESTDGSITNTYKFSDLESAYSSLNDVDFVGGVYVEIDCDDPTQEDEVVYKLMQDNPKILACMLRSDVTPCMRVPIFATGIREPLHIDTKPKGRVLEDGFVNGLRYLAKAGMPFESCNRVEDLENAFESFSKVPEATIILNHLGNVGELNDAYKDVMRKFATLPNLYLKVSGFPTEDKKFVDELLTFIKETFNADKLLYASNWPVVKLYSSFDEHFNVLREKFGDDEDFFMNNAARAYGLKLN